MMIDRIIVVCVIILGLMYLYATSQISSLQIGGDKTGPKAFPILLGILFILSALLLLVEIIREKGQAHEKKEDPKEQKRSLFLAGATVFLTLIYIMVFEPLGFLLSSTLYLFVLMSYFNRNKWWTNAIVSVMFPIAIYILFAKVLGVTLAKGLLYF
jgi:putative tricarboxylic transport membrane protein